MLINSHVAKLTDSIAIQKPPYKPNKHPISPMSKAFLLTRRAYDQKNSIHLEFWFSSDHGPIRSIFTQQKAVFFILQSDINAVEIALKATPSIKPSIEIKTIKLKNFSLQPMAAVYCQSLQQFYNAKNRLKEKQIAAYETDIRPAERFLSERFITGPVTIHNPQKHSQLTNPAIKADSYEPKLSLMSLDIETSYNSDEIYSIAYIYKDIHLVLMIGNMQSPPADINIQMLANETQLISTFIHHVQKHDPDIFIGWNVINFDFRFLQKKADQLHIPLNIGRSNSRIRWRESNTESNHYFLHIPGRVVLDGIDTLKSATWNFPSFSLDNVAHELLKRGKLIAQTDNHDPLYKAKEIKRQFYEDKPSLAKYNLEDCQLVLDIFKKTDLIHFAIERARLTGLEMDRVGGSVAAFDNLYLPRLHRKGFTSPNIGDNKSTHSAPGGYVMSSTPGLFKSVLVLDYKSLYPSIIRTFKVDPYGRIAAKQLTEDKTIAGYDGARFAKDEHILPQLIADLWQARDRAKLQKNSALSQAIKIIMNSFYGVLGTPGCRIHDARLTSSITKRSHDIIKQSVKLIIQQGYKVIYGDTDSVFVSLGQSHSNLEAKKIGLQLINIINEYWKQHLHSKYAIESYLEMEYETHFQCFFMPTIRGSDKGSKKRYAGMVSLNGEEKIIFKGLENVRTDWTLLAREFQQTLYQKIFNNEPYDIFIKQCVANLQAGQFDHQLIYRKRLRQSLHQYHKNIPPHARAAINAEVQFKQQKKPSRYQNKGWIEYVMTLNGPETLECQSAKLDYEHYIDKQLTPIANSILSVLGDSIDNLLKKQIDLF